MSSQTYVMVELDESNKTVSNFDRKVTVKKDARTGSWQAI